MTGDRGQHARLRVYLGQHGGELHEAVNEVVYALRRVGFVFTPGSIPTELDFAGHIDSEAHPLDVEAWIQRAILEELKLSEGTGVKCLSMAPAIPEIIKILLRQRNK